ncbi:MAG: hypothetical protein WCR54_05685 [Clostridia bacterium]
MKERMGNKKYVILFIMLILIVFVILCGISTSQNNAFAYSESFDLDDVDKAIIRDKQSISINDDFQEARLQVVIKHEYSLKSDKYTVFNQIKEVAKNIEIESIEGWISVDEIKTNELWNADTFHQILDIYLKSNENGKEVVIQAIEELSKLDIVLSVDPFYNYIIKDASTPNDPHFTNQWGLNGTYGINAEQAWNIESGNNSVIVGLLEGGAQKNHEDLDGLFLQENFTINGADSHGTYVAGIIGAKANNGIGVKCIPFGRQFFKSRFFCCNYVV